MVFDGIFIPKIAVASFSLIVPAMADVIQPIDLSSSEALISNNTFGNPDFSYAFGDGQDLQVMAISKQEMEDTEGAWGPVVVGVLHGARIVGTKVAQRTAVNMARNNSRGIFIHANSRQQAQQIARAASRGNNTSIRRELHKPTSRNPVQYRHYHPSGSNAHITWGKPVIRR